MIDEQPTTEAPGTRSGILRFEIDVRDGDPPGISILAAPSLDDVAEALASLDQRRHTELTIVDGSGAYLTVGGGRGHYHLYMGAYDHEDRIVLQNLEAAEDEEFEVVVDGTATRYSARDVVDLELASYAVQEFLRSSRPDPELTWRSG